MDATQPEPFRAQPDWTDNACINNWMQFAELASYYVRPADNLVSNALNDHMLLDVLVYPICFLYRHGLELILKDLSWKSHYLATGEKQFAKNDWKELGRHSLQELWQVGGEKAALVLGADFPLSTTDAQSVELLLNRFERHDPGSFSFRYPISKKKGRTHPDLANVNVRVLRESVHHVFQRLESVVGLVDYHYDQQSENEAESNGGPSDALP